MHFLDLAYLRRIFNVLKIGSIVLISSCQSDLIILNPPGGYEYITRSFQISTTDIFSIQGNHHTGHSTKLYSGIISLADSLEDTAYVLIRLLPELLNAHQVCNNPDSISRVIISLTSITPLAENDTSLLIPKDSLKIYLLPQDHISEDWDEDIILDRTHVEAISNNINDYSLLHDSLISIDNHSIEIELYDFDNSIIENWCENESNFRTSIIILYSPDVGTLNPEEPKYLEFVSSDVDASSMPMLHLEYQIKEASSITNNRYSILEVESSIGSIINPYYINDESIDAWGTVYVINGENVGDMELGSELDLESIIIIEDIISISQLNSSISLVQIDIELNSEIQDSIDGISFWLSNVKAFTSAIDPNEDNANAETNPAGTEFNDVWDEGEIFNDFGTDNCPDSLETGDGCGTSISIYNQTGTEGNNELDEDAGEEWWDWGIDGCPDSLETGLDDNICLEAGILNPDYVEGMDLNGDNYNPDPNNDNFSSDNQIGTEGNKQWDNGEQLFDWGSDGVHHTLMGYLDADSTEGNNQFDIGEEWWDYGTDGCQDEFESGTESLCLSVENPAFPGTEGNNKFDSMEKFEDCGIDNICNGDVNDAEDDNYNIDPNNDNFSSDNQNGTEGNEQWDSGEQLFDWGSDGVPDSLEAFQSSSIILPALYDNVYAVDVTEIVDTTFTPNLDSNTVSLWISNVKTWNGDSLSIQISIQTHIILKGLQFQLNHTPYMLVDSILQTYQSSIPNIGDNNEDNKLFEDMTLLAKATDTDSSVVGNTIRINYANDWSASINFDSLGIFLEKEAYTFAYPYTNLVMYIDTVQSDIDDDGMWLFLGYTDSDSIYTYVSSSADSILFPVGQIMAGFQNGSHGNYENLKLMTNSSLYNYSILSILYNLDQPDKNPRLDIMYSNE